MAETLRDAENVRRRTERAVNAAFACLIAAIGFGAALIGLLAFGEPNLGVLLAVEASIAVLGYVAVGWARRPAIWCLTRLEANERAEVELLMPLWARERPSLRSVTAARIAYERSCRRPRDAFAAHDQRRSRRPLLLRRWQAPRAARRQRRATFRVATAARGDPSPGDDDPSDLDGGASALTPAEVVRDEGAGLTAPVVPLSARPGETVKRDRGAPWSS
jgi:hypothetical protein